MDVIGVFVDIEGQEGAQVTFLTEKSNEHIAISLSKSNTKENRISRGSEDAHIIDHLIELLARSMDAEDEDEADALQDEALEVIYPVAKSLDQDSGASEESVQPRELVLHNLLFPKTSFYRLEEVAGKLTTVPIPPNEAYGPTHNEDQDQNMTGLEDNVYINTSLPSYLPEQIKVVEELVCGGGTVCLAQVNGCQMLCKARKDGLQNYNLKREIDCLQKISQENLGKILIPRLLGYVKHPRSGAILGFLREWIPSKDNLKDLKEAGFPDFPKEIRQKVGSQIKETVEILHGIKVVWGDAKPSNVVVDLNNDAWLIDFGGGWSEGWVDENLQNTVEGDQQAVARILEFLDVSISGM
ncbi:hypothetical protein KVR01_000732 [Diaporthe batatas]|uniref:uncharacterized protein n=1 Tax=Diaporthe batatas TaxID=748121 RepID=UPI001D054CDD|nr:uncharacterized protein KVR01_000732 [Diaporthe batatas]KAG8169987.1 hypothetical protein KVR01_000732 [Diaporthe batatas]